MPIEAYVSNYTMYQTLFDGLLFSLLMHSQYLLKYIPYPTTSYPLSATLN
jgi:hypothetical protein